MALDLTTEVGDQHSEHLVELELYDELVEFAEAPDSERIKVLARQIELSEFEIDAVAAASGETTPGPEILQVLSEANLAPTNNNETSSELVGEGLPHAGASPPSLAQAPAIATEGGSLAALPVSGALDTEYLKRPPSIPLTSNGSDRSLSWLGEPVIPVPPSTLAQDAAALGLTIHSGERSTKPNLQTSVPVASGPVEIPRTKSGELSKPSPTAKTTNSTNMAEPVSDTTSAEMQANANSAGVSPTAATNKNGNGQVIRTSSLPDLASSESDSQDRNQRSASSKAQVSKSSKPQSPTSKCAECGRGYHPDDLICIGCGAFVG